MNPFIPAVAPMLARMQCLKYRVIALAASGPKCPLAAIFSETQARARRKASYPCRRP
jgi:hypothetical protein